MPAKVRVGFVGAGGVATNHFRALAGMKDAHMVAFCDINKQRLAEVTGQYGGEGFRDAGKMYAKMDLDCVFICLPPFAHGEAEFGAIENGIPFIIEKPINNDIKQATKIAKGVKETGLLTSVAYMNRYRKGINTMRKLLQKDPPILVLGGWIGGEPRGRAPILNWWIQKKLSGGQMVEQVTHTVDLVRYLCGEAKEVWAAREKGRVKGIPKYTIDDAVAASIKFQAGAVANIHSCCASNAGGGVVLKVYANKVMGDFNGWGHDATIHQAGKEPEQIPGEGNIFEIEDAAFIKAVKTGKADPILCTYADGLETLRITLAMNESLETRQPVKIRPAKA